MNIKKHVLFAVLVSVAGCAYGMDSPESGLSQGLIRMQRQLEKEKQNLANQYKKDMQKINDRRTHTDCFFQVRNQLTEAYEELQQKLTQNPENGIQIWQDFFEKENKILAEAARNEEAHLKEIDVTVTPKAWEKFAKLCRGQRNTSEIKYKALCMHQEHDELIARSNETLKELLANHGINPDLAFA